MKMTLAKVLKRVAFTVSLLFLAFFIYANLEPAPMHAYVKPIKMAIFKIDGLTDTNQVSVISERVSQLAGVTACAANPVSELVSITFHPDQTSETILQQMVSNITRKRVQPQYLSQMVRKLPNARYLRSTLWLLKKQNMRFVSAKI